MGYAPSVLDFVLVEIAEKIFLSAHPLPSDTLDSSTDLVPKMKASQFGRQRTRGALLNGSASLTAKKSLGRTNQVPGSKKFCTLCPADCFQDILFQQAGNSHWNRFGFFGHVK